MAKSAKSTKAEAVVTAEDTAKVKKVENRKKVAAQSTQPSKITVRRGNGKVHIHTTVNNLLRSIRDGGTTQFSVEGLREAFDQEDPKAAAEVRDVDLARILSDRKCRGWITKTDKGLFALSIEPIKFAEKFGETWSDRDVE